MAEAPRKFDAVIVGAGAAGLMMAAKLGEAGKRVCVLELGPAWERTDLVSSQIWSRRLKWGGGHQLEGRNPVAVNFNSGWGVGGALIHQYANWPRMHPEDFRMRSMFGKGLDWPIGYDDLRPWYDRVQKEVGLSGDAKEEVWRPAGDPYPMPPLRTFRHGEVLAEGFRKAGLRVAPGPMAINSAVFNGRPACMYDGWCDGGCPIGALWNPFVAYLPTAQKHGADIRPGSYVTRVLTNDKGDRATAVEYIDTRTKERRTVAGDVIVLASFTGQTPRILLSSANERHPRGLANSSDTVGRYIMTHFAASAFGIFDEEMQNHMGTAGAQYISQDGYSKSLRKDFTGSYTWMIGAANKPNDFPGIANTNGAFFGNALHDFMKRAARGLAKIQAVIEAVPNPENRLTLSDRKDEFGVPIPRIVHALDDDAMKMFAHARDEGLRIMRGTGAKEVWASPGPALLHFIGGTPMGNDPKASVTDSYGRTHDVGNVFITGAGLYPTEGGVHPTFTLHALTWRTIDWMTRNWAAVT
jgi:choline dehydrogenase-like flavoprotein